MSRKIRREICVKIYHIRLLDSRPQVTKKKYEISKPNSVKNNGYYYILNTPEETNANTLYY